MPFYYSLIAALLPMLIYLIFIWYMDKYEREPFRKVFEHFLWGAIGAIVIGIILASILNFSLDFFSYRKEMKSLIGAIIIAPLVEETVKSLYLFKTYKKNYFDNLTDGLVYGSAIGLGFGMTENLLYFISFNDTYSQWIAVVIIRSAFSAVMHAIATATFGAFISKAKFTRGKNKLIFPFLGLLIAMIIHASWNISVSFNFSYYFGFLIIFALVIIFFIVFRLSLKNEENIIVQELSEEFSLDRNNALRLNSREDLLTLSKSFTERKTRKKFIKFATKLAFRKLQADKTEGELKNLYLNDIDKIRSEIKILVSEKKS